NIFAALLAGIINIETSVGGMGGCPFAPGAAGNVATEDLINLLDDMEIKTGVNLEAIIYCANMAQRFVKKDLDGHLLKAEQTFALHPLGCNKV
ncbi:MAG: hypothetical protein Q7J78_04435, partial [Clostridiales bacterium]|nr:hypothetical protein [Clostridiales bacterium]